MKDHNKVKTLGGAVLLLFFLLQLLVRSDAVFVFNVGLPRTGTTSFHYAAAILNLSTQHVAFNKTRYDLEQLNLAKNLRSFRERGQGPFRWLFDAFDAFSDTPVYGIIPAIKKWYPNVAIVATSRSRQSWVKSMLRNQGAGGVYLWKEAQLLKNISLKKCKDVPVYNHSTAKGAMQGVSTQTKKKLCISISRTEKHELLYDAHAALLDKYKIPRIDLTDNAQKKWTTLLNVLPQDNPHVKAAKQCLSMLEWPSQNQGHMTNIGINRLEANMSQANFDAMSSDCSFKFKKATAETIVVTPFSKKSKAKKTTLHYNLSQAIAYNTNEKKWIDITATNPPPCVTTAKATCTSVNSFWWKLSEADCENTDIMPQPACAVASQKNTNMLKSCCMSTPDCGGFSSNGVMKSSQCAKRLVKKKKVDAYILQEKPQPAITKVSNEYPGIVFHNNGIQYVRLFQYRNCDAPLATKKKKKKSHHTIAKTAACAIRPPNGNYNFKNAGCQDSEAAHHRSNRCWQSTLEKAVDICMKQKDCFGITRDNVGFEPRRGSNNDIRMTAAAHEMWVLLPRAISLNNLEPQQQSNPRQKHSSTKKTLEIKTAKPKSEAYKSFLEERHQRRVIMQTDGLELMSYRNCSLSGGTCNIVPQPSSNLKELRMREIKLITDYHKSPQLMQELNQLQGVIQVLQKDKQTQQPSQSFIFEGEICQDAEAFHQDQDRCWQSTLNKAAQICARHEDCAAIVHTINGYEPRRVGALQAFARERWIINHTTTKSRARYT